MADLRSLEEQKKKTQVEGVQSAAEIAKTIQQGGVPATSDVVKVLESTESAIDTQKANVALDEKGKTVLRDTENLLGATKELLEKKNIDEKLQTIVAEARLASESVPHAVGATGEQVLTDADIRKLEELKFKMLETAHIGQEVLKLVISSAEFRQILLTLVAISQSVFFEASEAAKQQPDPKSALQAGAEKVSQTFQEGVSEKVPERLRQELYAEYTALLRKVEAQPEWRQGVTNVFSLLDRIEVVSDQAAEKAKTAAVEIKLDRHAQEVVQSTKELVEEFLPGTKTLDPLINNVKTLAAEVRSDEKMLDFFGRLRNYFERALEDPSLVDKEEFEAEAQKLAQEGRALVGAEKYQDGIRRVLNEWREVIAGFSADEELNMFKSALEKLVKDFTIVDATGKRHLDTNAIYQIRQLLVPLIIEQLKFIPIPHLEGSNETYDWTADNIILSGYDIFPDHVKINTASETDIHIRDQTPGWTRGFMLIVIDGIKTKMSDMKFWYRRKSFPRMEDSGIADVDVAGGINIQIRLNVDTENSTGRLMFTTGSVLARADDVKVKVREAKHNWIYSLFPSTFASPIKNGMQKYIAESLAELVVRLKNSLNEAMITVTSANITETVEKVKQQIPTLSSGLAQQTA